MTRQRGCKFSFFDGRWTRGGEWPWGHEGGKEEGEGAEGMEEGGGAMKSMMDIGKYIRRKIRVVFLVISFYKMKWS